jgi:hypothetical protein
VDIGRVVIDGGGNPSEGDTAFFEGDEATMLATPEVPGAIAAIGRLATLFGGGVWLVSKCGPRTEERSKRWLEAHRFFERTGIAPGNLRFCRERADKRIHCVELGLTHFVDDRADVHRHIEDVVEHRYYFGPQDRPVPPPALHVPDWATAEAAIRASLAESDGEGEGEVQSV